VVSLWFENGDIDITHGKRNINAKPTASLRRTDMKRPFKRITARMKRRSSVITSTAAINCHRMYYFCEMRDCLQELMHSTPFVVLHTKLRHWPLSFRQGVFNSQLTRTINIAGMTQAVHRASVAQDARLCGFCGVRRR
jgi:hypothetical protein